MIHLGNVFFSIITIYCNIVISSLRNVTMPWKTIARHNKGPIGRRFLLHFGGSGLACVAASHWAYTSTVRRRERDEQEVYSTVEAIIDLLTRHHAACVAERRPQDAYLAVSHVRDALIPLKVIPMTDYRLPMIPWQIEVQLVQFGRIWISQFRRVLLSFS